MLHLDNKPFKRDYDNALQLAALVATTFTILVGYAILESSHASDTEADYGTWFFPVALVAINVLVLIIAIACGVVRAKSCIQASSA